MGTLALRTTYSPAGRRRGFTLVEVMVTAALLGVVLGLLVLPLLSSFRYFRTASARADATSVARMALDSMARELAEAMYVQLDMYDTSMIAFVPPLRVDPDDPTSDVVTPPRPDWGRMVRFWRALNDPERNYTPASHLGPGNTFYLARTVVTEPFRMDDYWNRWNYDWAAASGAPTEKGETAGWAPIPRVVHADVDFDLETGYLRARNVTLQPGYPYLWARWTYGTPLSAEGWRAYRARAVGLTPAALDYDVSHLEFNPTVVSGEWLRPVEGPNGPDYAHYQSRYPLWRLGVPYSGWTRLAEGPPEFLPPDVRGWARDPFLVIYRYDPNLGRYGDDPFCVAAFDPDTRTVKVLHPVTGVAVYDTGLYPVRAAPGSPNNVAVAFGITGEDYIEGRVRFDFPPPHDDNPSWMETGVPLMFAGDELRAGTVPDTGRVVYGAPLLEVWESQPTSLAYFLIPDSVRVRVGENDGLDIPGRVLKRVYREPREFSDEFQVGVDPALPDPDVDPTVPRYGWIRLPQRLADGRLANDPGLKYFVDFRWRSNGVWVKNTTYPMGRYFPDLVSAYYRTNAVIDISITVDRTDPGATADAPLAQSANLTRRVKLRNLTREIRYER